MQKIGIVICSRDIEAVLIKGKRILSANQSSLYYKIQSNWKGYAKSSRKFVMAEARIFQQLCSMAALKIHI